MRPGRAAERLRPPVAGVRQADQEFVFAGRSAFVEKDDGEVQLIVTSKTSDPCKADLGRRITEKQDYRGRAEGETAAEAPAEAASE